MAFVYWIHLAEHTDIISEGYIGFTKNSVEKRFKKHLHDSLKINSRCHTIHNAIRKHKDNLIVTTLVEGSEEYCLDVENKLRPTYAIGWNLAIGGVAPFKGYKPTSETIQKMVKNRTGKKASDETKQKMSKAQIGNTRALGYKHSQEAKDKISATASITTTKWLNPRASSVWSICLQLYDKFKQNSRNCDVAREFKVPESNVRNMYKRFRKGWNPNEDQEYLSWLEEKKGKQCHMNYSD